MKDLLEAKAVNDGLPIDEEIFDLLKRISKTKQFENKYRDKATVLLNKIIHFNDYQNTIIRDENNEEILNINADPSLLGKRTLKRSAKQNVDYKEKHGGPSKKKKTKDGSSQPGRRKSSVDSDAPEDDDDDDLDRSSGELDEQPQDSRKRFGRLCKDKKVEDEDSLGGDADEDMLDDKSPAPDIERELEQHLRREEAPKPKKDAKKKKAVEEEGGSSTQGSTHKGDKKAAKAEGKRDKKAKVVWLETKDREKVEKGPINPKTTQIVINLNKNQIEENEKSVRS